MSGTIPTVGGAGNLLDPFEGDLDADKGQRDDGDESVATGETVEVRLAGGGTVRGRLDRWCGADVPALWVELADGPAVLLLPVSARLEPSP